jgi:crotonobetainyl-CoA:carnitine CoA-transferase CaiB-like acyl-CoA transferase
VGLSHPTIAPYGAFSVAGGQQVLVGVQNDGEWRRFATDVLRRPDLAAQDRFATNRGRVEHRAELDAEVAAGLATLTPEEAHERLARAKVAYASVNTVAELSSHPHLRRIAVPTAGGEVTMAAPPYRFRDQPRRYGAVPTLDRHGPALRAEFGPAAEA